MISSGELLEICKEKIAESFGRTVKDYYAINAFDRRDKIAANGGIIAQALGCSTVEATCVQAGTDEAYICQAIERFASVVYGSFR